MADHVTAGQLYPGAVHPSVRLRQPHQPASSAAGAGNKASFQDVLGQQMVRFSHHAEVRLQQRGIELKPEQLAKIENAINNASAKGAKDSLMLLGDMALIVNVKNRTIVTAMDGNAMKDNVFTQIDSAVIIS